MDMTWDDLRTVMALVRHGSLAGAGAALSVNYTTIARRIRRAEEASGEVLFERLSDGYRPTDAALLIAEHAEQMEQAEHGLMRRLKGAETHLSGILTITAPQLLIASFLSPVLDQFTRTHPDVELRVLATNELLDLSRREADLAIRVSRAPGDALTGLRLLYQDSASFANADWAARIARDPQTQINWVAYDSFPDVPKGTNPDYPNQKVRFRFDDMVAMVGAAQAGLGIVRMPMFLGRTNAGLQQVPVLAPQPYPEIWVVGHPDVWPSAKLRAFRGVLIAHCKAHKALFVA
ncbi:LysR family transcriptional regulator [Litoreibacter meonggei]|uniref:LysR family transcriptional regulator n=1 Tax=Litoreibacter meonggei TaxID=1049199 RepID=A0A497VD82_9RHOB|nr:LysR family transcriptional regulator [Litoreibacter meonggei]RLJ41252.1 LysR family transcriptional regulator [Litoreibacter meonggei]